MWNWETEAESLGVTTDKNSFLNIGREITDRICERGYSEKTAVIWKGRSGIEKQLTYGFLAAESSRFAAYLSSLGVSKGDRVFIYTDRIPELYIAIPAIIKTGAVAGPLFSSFGTEALRDRLMSAGASVIIVQNSLLDNIVKIWGDLPCLKYVISVGGDISRSSDIQGLRSFDEAASFEPRFDCENTKPDEPAVIHYTSGTTGRPKGAVHAQSALTGHYSTSRHILDIKENDIYWCTADPAWVTGMSYGVIGPMSNAASQVSVEGNISPKILLETISKYKVTVLYTAPTLLRMLMREKEDTVKAYDLSSLRHIASVGEALNPEVIRWSEKTLGLPVYDTWFQTETGCIMIANTPETGLRPGSMGKPIPPVTAAVLDNDFNPLPPGSEGKLALKPGWPSMFRDYWNNTETYKTKFKNGWYMTGDNARLDNEGRFWFLAREDDVINTAGHLVSPFEVESVLLEHPAVAEAAVIGIPDSSLGEKIKAFIVTRPGISASGSLKLELRSQVRKLSSPFAVPQEIDMIESLPKTRTGKIMRRLLRSRELGIPEGDLSTLEE